MLNNDDPVLAVAYRHKQVGREQEVNKVAHKVNRPLNFKDLGLPEVDWTNEGEQFVYYMAAILVSNQHYYLCLVNLDKQVSCLRD
jgi:hypothetical protein